MPLLPPILRKAVLDGLSSAFADAQEFDSFLRTELSKNRHDIASDALPYKIQVEKTVEDAERKHWISKLLDAANRHQPSNEKLAIAKTEFEQFEKRKAFLGHLEQAIDKEEFCQILATGLQNLVNPQELRDVLDAEFGDADNIFVKDSVFKDNCNQTVEWAKSSNQIFALVIGLKHSWSIKQRSNEVLRKWMDKPAPPSLLESIEQAIVECDPHRIRIRTSGTNAIHISDLFVFGKTTKDGRPVPIGYLCGIGEDQKISNEESDQGLRELIVPMIR